MNDNYAYWDNYYSCHRCAHRWVDQRFGSGEMNCPKCGALAMPYKSLDIVAEGGVAANARRAGPLTWQENYAARKKQQATIMLIIGAIIVPVVFAMTMCSVQRSSITAPDTVTRPSNDQRTITGDFIGCVSESAEEHMTNALASGDKQLYASMILDGECAFTQGLRYSVLNSGFVYSQVRVYMPGGARDLWVPVEATQ